MYKTIDEAVRFVRELRPLVAQAEHCEIIVAPPFTALRAAADALRGSNIAVAAQDAHWDAEGAHTGDISPRMALDAGCTHVILGHSERRHDHGETDEDVNRKLKAALGAGLLPIVCVGETLAERESGRTEEVLAWQFSRGFLGLTPPEFSRIMMAYEPVWAIGTGRTATPEMAAASHAQLRGLVGERCGGVAADQMRILYGGSVKPENIRGLATKTDIDGALVGGASLRVDSFAAIVNNSRA